MVVGSPSIDGQNAYSAGWALAEMKGANYDAAVMD
jgi:hypothetical protein